MDLSGFDTNAESLEAVSLDFGRVLHKRPQAVARVASAEEVSEIIRKAGRWGCPVSFQGAAHSQGGQSLSDGGIVLDMKGLDRIGDIEDGTVRVQGGVLWRDLINRVLSHGYIPMVTTTGLGATVGGTISVGGYGTASHLYGAQTDNVTELEVVTGEGRLLRCSPSAQTALFDCARGGLGQFAAITEARIRLRKAPPELWVCEVEFDDVEALMLDMARIVSRDHFQHIRIICLPIVRDFRRLLAGETPFTRILYQVYLTAELDSAPDEAASAEMLSGISHGRILGCYTAKIDKFIDPTSPLPGVTLPFDDRTLAHPAVEAFLPWENAANGVLEVLSGLPPSIALHSIVLLAPFRRDRLRSPMIAYPAGDLLMGFSILPDLPSSSLKRTLPVLEEAGNRMTQAGGKRHLSGWVDYDHVQWKEHYGDLWPRIMEWKSAFDPKGILNPGFVRYRP